MTARSASRPAGHRTPSSRGALMWLRGEDGSAAIEAAVGVPAFLLLIAMVLLAGRVALAHQDVQAVAADAARAASLARTPGAAQAAATRAGHAGLAGEGLSCVSSSVSADTAGFGAPVGTPATVTAIVTCEVRLADLAIPGLPGSRIIRVEMSSPMDTYRARTGGSVNAAQPVRAEEAVRR